MGLVTFRSQLNLLYYGSGNPGTWNPDERPGDNKWSMTIFARNPDTGVAAWAYQMTPHDAWDYDGINEMVLTDSQVGAQPCQRWLILTATALLTCSIAAAASSLRPLNLTRP